METHNTYITAIFTLTSSVVTLVLGFSFSLWSQSKKNAQELKLKKLEQKHKISEETYQKLFEKKIEVYNKLHKKLHLTKEKLLDVGFPEYSKNERGGIEIHSITGANIYCQLIKTLHEYLEDNIFYISEELEKKFKEIDLAYLLHKSFFSWDFENKVDSANMTEEVNQNNRKFYEKHKLKINELIELMEKEIKMIKSEITFD